jgi:hypothetical protein
MTGDLLEYNKSGRKDRGAPFFRKTDCIICGVYMIATNVVIDKSRLLVSPWVSSNSTPAKDIRKLPISFMVCFLSRGIAFMQEVFFASGGSVRDPYYLEKTEHDVHSVCCTNCNSVCYISFVGIKVIGNCPIPHGHGSWHVGIPIILSFSRYRVSRIDQTLGQFYGNTGFLSP